jgi:hypothetical protein
VKRRKALQQIGLGVTGGIFLPGLLSRCSPADPGPEVNYAGTVAIIGAGAAGLYVADILRSKGIKVVLYEAGNQIGGRVKSVRNQPVESYPSIPDMSSDFPLELGADTYIGTDSTLGKIVQVYRLFTTEFDPANNHFVLDNTAKSAADWGSDPDFTAAMSFRQNLKTMAGSSQSVQQAIVAAGIGSRAHGMLNGQIGNVYGADNDLAGIGGLGEEETLRTGDGKILVLTGNPLQELLISRFNGVLPLVKLSTPIASIQYDADPIVLTGKDGTTYQADKVIVTAPVSVLKSGDLAFSPGLPGTHTASLAKIGMGASFRCIIEFKRNFWGESPGFILGSTNVPEFMSLGVGRSAFNSTLQITVNGSKALQYSALGAGAIDAILADLDVLYSGQATQFVRKHMVVDKDTGVATETTPIYLQEDWTTREYILGGYSYPLPGASTEDRKNIGAPVNNKLFFAGEATDITGNAGMVNGALASAERCAEEVVKSIIEPA